MGTGVFPNFFVVGAPGTCSGSYNCGETLTSSGGLSPAADYSYNYLPDFVVKAAFEAGLGHYEMFGVVSHFRDRIYPANNITAPLPTPTCGVAVPSATTRPCSNVRIGAGVGANARWSFLRDHVEFGLHFLGGDGVGRYGVSGMPEVTLRPDGTLALIRSYQALETLEWHSPHWDIYTNVGGEYAQRTLFTSPNGVQFGYGRTTEYTTAACFTETPPGALTNGTKPGFQPAAPSCPDTRNLIEGTFGFWYSLYHGPKGRVQFGPQYSYLVLNTWRNTTGGPHATQNMFFSSLRYYLP